jgi:hypothetical protein
MTGGWRELFATLIPLALVVALSPLSIIPALLLVLHAARPKPTGLGFLLGWVVGLAAVTVVFVQVPHLLGGFDRDAPTWTSWLRIGIGVALILFGCRRWATRERDAQTPPKWLTMVNRITPLSAATIGVVLVLINPKILLVTAAAGLSIGTAELSSTAATVAVAFYTTVAASNGRGADPGVHDCRRAGRSAARAGTEVDRASSGRHHRGDSDSDRPRVVIHGRSGPLTEDPGTEWL